MSDGILKAVQAHGDGITANESLTICHANLRWRSCRTILVLRCNATAGPAGSKIAISAGTFRLQRKTSSDGSRRNRLIAGRVDRGFRPIAGPGDRDLPALFVFGAIQTASGATATTSAPVGPTSSGRSSSVISRKVILAITFMYPSST
jgi:hypothetical protein